MTESKDEIPEETTQNHAEPEPAQQDEDRWFDVILGIPYVGDFLTTVIGILPMILIFAIFNFEEDTGAGDVIGPAEFWTTLLSIPVLYAWLLFLERKLRLAICLPLPIVSIRLKWLLIPFGLLWIYIYFIGEKL